MNYFVLNAKPFQAVSSIEKQEFRDTLERLMGMVELEVRLCIAGDFIMHVGVTELGEKEHFGKFDWGTRKRESQELVELVARNGMATAGSFFQKWENHKITYRSGHQRT